MSCNDLDAEGYTPGNQSSHNYKFDFDQWIKLHGLTDVKDLLCKYNMNIIETLSLTSTQCMRFMNDIELLKNKSEYIPKVLKAIKSLNTDNISAYSSPTISNAENIVISQIEQDVIHNLKQNMNELDKLEIDLNGLKINYLQSIKRKQNQTVKQITTAKQQINKTFDDLRNALNIRQQYLLKELDNMYSNDEVDIKQQEIDPFKDTSIEISAQKDKLKQELQLFNETIKLQQSRTVEKRQEIILMMAKQSDDDFKISVDKINEKQNKTKKLISQNYEKIVQINYNQNETKYNNILQKINSLGAINVRDDSDSEELLKQIYKQNTMLLMDSLKLNESLPFRWYNEEKEQHIIVKIIEENPLKIVQGPGIIKTDCEKLVSLKPENVTDMTDIALCVDFMRESFETYGEKLKWMKIDSWDANCKCLGIKINKTGDTIKSGQGYQSIFGKMICRSPYKYHWKLKQISDNGQDFYVGVERKGKEIVNNYFCKSETGYAFSGYYAQLYSNDHWGKIYGVKCTNKGDVIDVYLDLEKNELSYSINDKHYGKAYDVITGEYRLAFTIHIDAFGMSGERLVQLVSSTMHE